MDDPQIIIAGIGSAIGFKNIDYGVYDEIHWLGFDHARAGAVALLRDTGIFAGLSSGAGYLVSRWVRDARPGGRVVMIAADTGHRYADRVYGDPAPPIAGLTPLWVEDLDALRTPWCVMDWAGRHHAIAGSGS